MGTLRSVVDRHASVEERQAALRQIYTQVLERQPYAHERRILAKAEQDFLKDKIGVRRFLMELARSEVYLNSFYHRVSNLKFIEWCFKHFLGRAPMDQNEVREYCNILMHKGAEKCIAAILDSEEYRKEFGCFTVPYPREQRYYASPKVFLESGILNHEHFGQRGWIVPTLYWHELGLDCTAGVCRHPEADEILDPPISAESEALQEKLLELLDAFETSTQSASEAFASLSPSQREALRRVIH